jgi:site-specific recombinase XerD
MGRSGLVVLEGKDIHSDFLIAHGKGNKERVIPLLPAIATRLNNFAQGMKPGEKVFKLKAVSIGNKIRVFALKAGLSTFHTHTMRRQKFATDLVEKGADINSVLYRRAYWFG